MVRHTIGMQSKTAGLAAGIMAGANAVQAVLAAAGYSGSGAGGHMLAALGYALLGYGVWKRSMVCALMLLGGSMTGWSAAGVPGLSAAPSALLPTVLYAVGAAGCWRYYRDLQCEFDRTVLILRETAIAGVVFALSLAAESVLWGGWLYYPDAALCLFLSYGTYRKQGVCVFLLLLEFLFGWVRSFAGMADVMTMVVYGIGLLIFVRGAQAAVTYHRMMSGAPQRHRLTRPYVSGEGDVSRGFSAPAAGSYAGFPGEVLSGVPSHGGKK